MSEIYEKCKSYADYIKANNGGFEPEIGIILGTGLGSFGERIENALELAYKDIPGYPVSTAPGHAGKFIFGTVAGKKVACMSGRFHFYEGYDQTVLSVPARVFKLLGVKKLIVTNAAGAINPEFRPGDLMLITDHIKFAAMSPVIGPNADEFGERFFDMSRVYDKDMLNVARECAKSAKIKVNEGVYMFFGGPQFETPAEIRAARVLGADAAGMSTVPEVITASQAGLPVLGISLMTNMAAGVIEAAIDADHVDDVAEDAAPYFEEYFTNIIANL